jgi:GTPase
LDQIQTVHEIQRSDGVASEKAVLVRVILPGQFVGDDPLDEITGLAQTAGTRIVSGLVQRREKPDVTAYLGKGKIEELKQVVEHHDADVVIFDNDLAPSQTRNLERTLGVKVLDRTELILDIFASNAKTYEARLAVELAQLEYSLPRLKRMWTHLSRIKAGIGMRGPGEKQLEEDRRLALNRIHELKTEMHAIERRKERLVASRNDRLTVSLVGYTNAGKSTLMNALTGAGVYAANKLFATLDTAELGAGVAVRHRRLHSRSAARAGRQFQGNSRGGAAGRSLDARRRRRQSGRPGTDQRRL